MNKRIVFSTDLTLAIVWPITLATGLIIHAAGHGIVQQGVQLWTALHTLFGILFSQFPSCTSKRIGDGTKVWSEATNATAKSQWDYRWPTC